MHIRSVVRALVVFASILAPLAEPATAVAGRIEVLPVASVTIYPGDLIAEEMLTDAKFPEGTSVNLPVIVSRADLTGMVARRTILPGRLIARNAVGRPELVARGAIVPAIYEDGDLVITASVLALQSGSLNEMVQVRNIDSGKVIVGLVQADGTIRVGGQ